LADVIQHLQDAYGVTIEVKNKSMLNCMLTGYFAEPEVENILQMIAVTFKLNYTKEGNTYYLDGEGCN
jgi:transmembrane sensor